MIPENLLQELQILANRFDWTIGIFVSAGLAYIELVKSPGSYVQIISPSRYTEDHRNYRIADDTAKWIASHVLRSLDLRTPISQASQVANAPV